MQPERIEQSIVAQQSEIFSLSEGALTIDTHGEITYASLGAEALFNRSKYDLLGSTIVSLFPTSSGMTQVRHEKLVNDKIDGWVSDLARGSVPRGQNMKGRSPIEFSHPTYPNFWAKVGFYPLFVGFSAEEIIAAAKDQFQDQTTWDEKRKIIRDFLAEHDCLHILTVFFRTDDKPKKEAEAKLEKIGKAEIKDAPKSEKAELIHTSSNAIATVIPAMSGNWRAVIVSISSLVSILIGVLIWQGKVDLSSPPPAVSEPEQPCKRLPNGQLDCSFQ